MVDWPEGITNIDAAVDIVESPEDGGFYLSRYKPSRATSRIYDTLSDALAAYRSGKVRWKA